MTSVVGCGRGPPLPHRQLLTMTSVQSGLIPPPSLGVSSSGSHISMSSGGQFLGLVRSIEKASGAHRAILIRDAVVMLKGLLDVYSRRGLLEGDVARAQKLIESVSSDLSTAPGTRRAERGVKKGSRDEANLDQRPARTSQANETDDESLLLSALVRLLGGNQRLDSTVHAVEHDKIQLVALASDICTSISEHAKSTDNGHSMMCAQAETQLLFAMGRSILTGIVRTLHSLSASEATATAIECAERSLATSSCLRAATSLVSLFGLKISKYTAILSELRSIGWVLLTSDWDPNIRKPSAMLLATLPSLSGGEKVHPADAWSELFFDTSVALLRLLEAVAPLSKRSAPQSIACSDDMTTRVDNWVHVIKHKFQEEGCRVESVSVVMRGLTSVLQALLSREAHDSKAIKLMNTARIPLEIVLKLVQKMISFPSVAESRFHSTTKRLRFEQVEGGLLSIASITVDLANPLRSLGHDILDALLTGLGGPCLLPFSRRILRIAHSSLLSTASTVVRKTLDAASSLSASGKQKWLHASVPMRARAINSFRLTLESFGSNSVVVPIDGNGRGSNHSGEVIKGITVVVGCLLEQLSWEGGVEWGTMCERVGLMTPACDCLAAVLGSTGAFLPLVTRSLVESTAVTALASVRMKCNGSRICQWASVRAAALQLGMACLTVPWPDGAMSSILADVRSTAIALQLDGSVLVSATCSQCIRLCDSLSTPRVPALVLPTRSADKQRQDRDTTSVDSLMKAIQISREELQAEIISPSQEPETTPLRTAEVKQTRVKRQRLCSDSEKVPSTNKNSPRAMETLPATEKPSDDRQDGIVIEDSLQNTIEFAPEATRATRTPNETSQHHRESAHEDGATPGMIQNNLAITLEDAFDRRSDNVQLMRNDVNLTPDEEKSDDDEYLPEIVDCGPDEEDM